MPHQLKTSSFILSVLLLVTTAVWAQEIDYFQEFDYDDFTPGDFEKFFGLIVDGKITPEKLNGMCSKHKLGFTVEAKDTTIEVPSGRLFYNVSQQLGAVDGRSFRSRYFNASLGEWTGSVFKPICPGLYFFSLDLTASVSQEADSDLSLHLMLRRPDWERPGKTVATALKASTSLRGGGHTSVVLLMGTGDEVSTIFEGPAQAKLEVVRLSVHKVTHIEELVQEFDVEVWNQDLKALESVAITGP